MWRNVFLQRTASLSLRTPTIHRRALSSEIFVSRLSHYTTDEEFEDAFSRFGHVKQASLVKDRVTKRPKGYGFVTYDSEAEAAKAIKSMDGRIFGGRLIFVEVAKPRP